MRNKSKKSEQKNNRKWRITAIYGLVFPDEKIIFFRPINMILPKLRKLIYCVFL